MAGLSPKQSKFANEYLIDLNATQAALRAGYSKPNKQGPRLLVNVGIQAAITEAMQARAKRTEITQDKVITDVELIKHDAMREKADKEGNTEMVNHAAALKACELQGRHLKMWHDKVALSNPDGSPLLQNLTVTLVKAAPSGD